MRMKLITSTLFVGALLFSPTVGLAGSLSPYDDIISFGDSLTDVGNVAGVTDSGNAPRINGYYQQTHFSDNIVWVEQLANFWNLPTRTPGRGDVTTLPPQPNGNVWAWGGSEAASGTVQPNGVTEPIPNLQLEVSQYLAKNTANPDALYTIWSGANNLLVGGKFGPQAAADAVGAVGDALKTLEAAGVRHFVVFNMPRLGDTPEAQAGGIIDEAIANEFATVYNDTLEAVLFELRRDPLFRADIFEVDTYTELALVVDTVNSGQPYTPDFFVPGDPVTITNVIDKGLDFFNNTGMFPPGYLFWDDVHPTTQGHQVVAGLVLQAVIPTPAAAGAGLALLAGLACRRSRPGGRA